MTFEQPASLNRFVAEPIPLTWASRWKFIRIFLPILVFITICLLERIAFEMWKTDKVNLSLLWLALVPSICLLVLFIILGELRIRRSQQVAKRVLHLLEKGISFHAGGRASIRWPKVVAFWLEDVSGAPDLSKVTIEYFGNRKTKFPLRYSLALNKQNQYGALVAELQLLQQQHRLNLRIEHGQPLPVRREPRRFMLGISLSLAGFLILMHGAPLILVPLTHHYGENHHSDAGNQWSPKQQEKLAKFVRSHFPSQAELDRFMIGTGSILSAIGVGLLILGKVIQKEKTIENKEKESQVT